eukprot:CAMPEP_0198267916 /NCGR_PEP_ID=MMETSP1447-20131203/35165_1 /TAXON_ID=420782 /ORGANISM="Chaetoceros dichaeta, Strain CCMP1751" /LENGTH=445 /DNA_ID=CAMNT_0043958743 /DNA_START=124 /DNA_END=1461 /DNA_ORIENTATION=-
MNSNELYSTAKKDAEIDNGKSIPSDSNNTTHFVFLVHGWLGNDLEMKYLESAIETSKKKYYSQPLNPNQERLVVHRTRNNNGHTKDGILEGATRLANEIKDFILKDTAEQLNRDKDSNIHEKHVSISFVGNSLGGLYARYAISLIPAELNIDNIIPNTRVVIHSNVFCTTATPHLGTASHTYIAVPRIVEKGIGKLLSKTGKDLFRSDGNSDGDDLIYEMCTDYEQFLLPLSKFQKRIAYANAFGTDFQVPTNTAAFLSEKSMHNHCPTDPSLFGKDDNEMKNGAEDSFIVAMVTTEQNNDILKENGSKERKHYSLTMSNKMDALGWTKVFIDVRGIIPGPRLNRPLAARQMTRRQIWSNFLQKKLSTSKTYDDIRVTSQDLARLMNGSETIGIPIGHQVMIANSKNKRYSDMTANGKPVMDKLANDLVHSILETEGKDSVPDQS